MKTGKTGNPVLDYLDKNSISLNQFARASLVPFSTLQRIAHKRAPLNIRRYTAIKISRATAGEISLEDLGIGEDLRNVL